MANPEIREADVDRATPANLLRASGSLVILIELAPVVLEVLGMVVSRQDFDNVKREKTSPRSKPVDEQSVLCRVRCKVWEKIIR